MNNYFVINPPFCRTNHSNERFVFINKLLKKIGLRLTGSFDTAADMNSLEQRINFFHLLRSVLDNDIPGELVELGTFTGQSALLFQKTLSIQPSSKSLHLYDSFNVQFKESGDVLEVLKANFIKAKLPIPHIHKGLFEETIPEQLPEQIAFAHIDCGWGGDPKVHEELILFCMKHIYPRLSPGAVCVFMDYYDPKMNPFVPKSYHLDKINIGVRKAVNDFFKDKIEKPFLLYGGQASHGYIIKQ